MNILGRLAPRQVDGADEVLEGILWESASGNRCCVWPVLTHDLELRETRVAFVTGWRVEPSPEDFKELMAFTDSLMGKAPDFVTAHQGDPCTNSVNTEWLRTGQKPKVN